MNTFSPFRSTVTYKPQSACPGVTLFACPVCHRAYQAVGPEPHLPPVCCGREMPQLQALAENAMPEGYRIHYTIVGGLDYDAVKVFWHSPGNIKPAWIILKTFTGSYIRYLTPQKKAPATFALADEDAYVYCNKPVCQRCTFRCKLGFAIYIFFAEPGLLLEMTLDKVAPRFKAPLD